MLTLRQVVNVGVVSTDNVGLLWWVGEKLSYKPMYTFFPPMFVLRDWLVLQDNCEHKTALLDIFTMFSDSLYDFEAILLVDTTHIKEG